MKVSALVHYFTVCGVEGKGKGGGKKRQRKELGELGHLWTWLVSLALERYEDMAEGQKRSSGQSLLMGSAGSSSSLLLCTSVSPLLSLGSHRSESTNQNKQTPF